MSSQLEPRDMVTRHWSAYPLIWQVSIDINMDVQMYVLNLRDTGDIRIPGGVDVRMYGRSMALWL